MARGIQIELGISTFATKKAAMAAVREILHSYSVGQIVEEERHWTLLWDLLHKHPNADQKIGCGIADFRVQQEKVHGTKCFWVVRKDGTSTDFSYIECFTPSSPRQKALKALRLAVEDQCRSFKKRRFGISVEIPCEATGELVTSNNCAVDHIIPFHVLVDEFCTSRDIAVEAIETEPTRDGETITLISDKTVLADWLGFHQEKAQLRITTREFNSKRGLT